MTTLVKILIIILIILILLFAVYIFLKNNEINNNKNNMQLNKKNLIIRKPAVAGQFYPADKDELNNLMISFLEKSKDIKVDGLQILLIPHAGYIFSGSIAAQGFKTIENKEFDTVILLGNSHQEYFSGLMLDGSDIWETPLGQIELDKKLINKLSNNKLININSKIHLAEHSLEVELPWLQKVLNNNFKLIPGLFGSDNNLEDLKNIAGNILEIINNRILIVISTDLSHYPNYEDAKIIDNKTIDLILQGDAKKFLQASDSCQDIYNNLSTCVCAWPAVATGMLLSSRLNLSAELLDYKNSGDIEIYGDKDRVVGYASIIFKKQELNNKNMLNQQEQKVALKLARQTLEKSFNLVNDVSEEYKNFNIFNEKRGVFVTLNKSNNLRGCIGLIEPPEIPLYQAIQEMALSAAFDDTRFYKLTRDELDEIKIEISVLTAPKKSDVNKIELGKHGVIIKSEFNSGVFLPQVATETGWNKEQFLSELCSQKAGLNFDCYLDPDVDVYTFEAQVFEES